MTEHLKHKTELLVENRNIISKGFLFEYVHTHCLCAYICADKNITADPAMIKQCKHIIRENTKLFSPFKAVSFLPTAAALSLDRNPESLFQEVLKVYSLLKDHNFKNSEFLPPTALSIAQHTKSYNYDTVIQKAYALYQEMKTNHPFLTSREDYGYAVMLAMSDIEIPELIQNMEDTYAALKGDFFSNNAVQSLSHILALSTESANVKREKVLYIYEKLKEQKCKYGTGYELSSLGILALLPSSPDRLIQDIVTTEAYLRKCKGFGNFSLGRPSRVMYAASLVASDSIQGIENISLQTSVSSAITKSIIAMETAIIASAVAASAAASNASSGTT